MQINIKGILELLQISEKERNFQLGINLYESNKLSAEAFAYYLQDTYNLSIEQLTKIKNILNVQNKQKEGNELISVIIPTYKRGELITQAINSILMQTYQNYEIIIVDDCSPDNTKEVVKEKYGMNKKVKYYCNSINSGAGVSRKNGYNRSNGKYIIFMDDDDYFIDTQFFSKAMEIFKKEPNLSFVSANSLVKYEIDNKYEFQPLNITKKINNIEYLKKFQIEYMKPNSTFTTIFKKDDMYNIKDVEMLNDSSIFLRSLLKNEVYILDDIIGIYGVHSSNMSFGIKLDFLIENLQEKKKINEIIKKNHLLLDKEKWIYKQVMLTANYYITGSNPSEEEFKKLLEWCKKNITENKIEEELTDLYLKVRH